LSVPDRGTKRKHEDDDRNVEAPNDAIMELKLAKIVYVEALKAVSEENCSGEYFMQGHGL
jgi:hypothetical protein